MEELALWAARIAIYASLAFVVYSLAVKKTEDRIRRQLPVHNHPPVDKCFRCKVDRTLDL